MMASVWFIIIFGLTTAEGATDPEIYNQSFPNKLECIENATSKVSKILQDHKEQQRIGVICVEGWIQGQ